MNQEISLVDISDAGDGASAQARATLYETV
jgi:hypothetical protein